MSTQDTNTHRLYLPAHTPNVTQGASKERGRYAMDNVLLRLHPSPPHGYAQAELVATDGRVLVRTALQPFDTVDNPDGGYQAACKELETLPAIQLPGGCVAEWIKGRKSLERWIELDNTVISLHRSDGASWIACDAMITDGMEYPRVDEVFDGLPKADTKDASITTLTLGKEYLEKILKATGGDSITFTFKNPEQHHTLGNQVSQAIRVTATRGGGREPEPTNVEAVVMPVTVEN